MVFALTIMRTGYDKHFISNHSQPGWWSTLETSTSENDSIKEAIVLQNVAWNLLHGIL